MQLIYNVLCILGCLLGAGFISGAEVNTFFVKFGYFGIVGIILSSVIFSIVICRSKKQSNPKFNFMPYCQLFISGAMLAGLTNVIANLIHIKYYVVLILLGFILFLSLILGIRFANFFNVLVSVATIIILPLAIKNIGFEQVCIAVNGSLTLSIVYAVLYSIINIVACMPVIQTVSKNKKIVAIFSGIISSVLLMIIFVVLASNSASFEMPILELLNVGVLKNIYTILFIVAMISTLLSASSGAKQVFEKMDNNILKSLCTCLALCSVSFLGFGKIINYIYPIIGVVIFLQIILNKMYKRGQKTQNITK